MSVPLDFIDRYISARNSADGSLVDANANVSCKNAAVLASEIHKQANIRIHRELMDRKLRELFGDSTAEHYREQLDQHEIYTHDETAPFMPYCASVSLFPLLQQGLVPLGGESKAPKHLASFCGSFINFVFAISANLAGACATVEFLNCFDHFARKDYGTDYLATHRFEIENHLQHVVYALNQPAAARSYQSVFWNISVFDQNYFESMFGDFVFPDGDHPSWTSVSRLQAFFLEWFNRERERSLLTFPVVTAALVHDREEPRDRHFADLLATQLAAGNSFFIYTSDSVDSLSSCCRLRNALDGDNDFSFSLGAGGVMTGSMQVMTINFNREASREYDARFNTEFVPAENLGVKFARWDREAGYRVPRPCYNSYFYPVERDDIHILDKLILHGDRVTRYLDGGSALHLNLESYPTEESFAKLIRTDCNYFCTNVRVTCCNDCGHIDKLTRDHCPSCGSQNVDHATRIIGYLKRVSSWSSERRHEHDRRAYQST